MTASVTDAFAGAAGALNGRTTDTGALTWAADSGLQLDGSGKVVNNGAQYTAVGRVTPVGSAGEDLDVTLRNVTIDTGYTAGLELARDGSGNQYQVNVNQYDLTVVLYRNGVAVLTSPVPGTTGADISARLRHRGSAAVITVAVAGIDRLIYTDTSPLTGRGCSFFLQQLGTNSADAFEATATAPATSTTYSDDFNRPDGAPGSPWVQGGNGTAVANIIGDAIGNSGPYGDRFSGQQPTVKQIIGVGDLDISARIAALPDADDMGITFRASPLYSEGSTWFAAVAQDGYMLLYSPAVGAPGSSTVASVGDTMRVTVIGDTVTLYRNGIYADSRTEANGRNNVWAGLYLEFNNTAGRLDDFTATVIPRPSAGWSVGRIAWN